MVKAVQAEDSISDYFDGLLKNRVQAEVGLLVGKPSVGSRDIALAVIPTPTQEGEQVLTVTANSSTAAKPKKASGPKVKSNEPTVAIDLEAGLIAEHALQVSRMLPGGLSVLGLYLFAPESGYSSASSQLCSTLVSIAEDSSSQSSSSTSSTAAAAAAAVTAAASSAAGAAAQAPSSNPPLELLLLHVDSSSRRFSMRSCQVSSAATATSTLKPCDLKFGSSLSSLVCLRCSHSFDLTLPANSDETQMQQLLQGAVAIESARVLSAVAAVQGQVPSSSNQPIGDLLPSSSSTAEAAQVQLYCLPQAAAALQGSTGNTGGSSSGSSSSGYVGSSRLHGSVKAIAYVHKRDPVSKALAELKHDITWSLSARFQLLVDEALADAADAAEQLPAADAVHAVHVCAAAGKRVRVGLARRVLLPWSSLNLQVCDYLAEGEGPDSAVDRAQQLLQLEGLQASQVEEIEGPAVKKQKVVAGTSAGDTQGGSAAGTASCSAAVMAAAAAGLVAAAAVGIGVMNLGQ